MSVAGLALPRRATVALVLTSAIVLADYTGLFLQPPIALFGSVADVGARTALERFVVFGIVPAATIALAFRDRLGRYGLRLGEWRWGAGFLVVGVVVMTPVVLVLARLPDFGSYYGTSQPLGQSIVENAVTIIPAEFLIRGFLLFALLRRIGPLAIVVVQIPFVFGHIGKPELELWSTFIGGSVFAWLNWRTGSIVWSGLAHLYVLSLMVAAASAAPT